MSGIGGTYGHTESKDGHHREDDGQEDGDEGTHRVLDIKVLTSDLAAVVESERTALGCKVVLFGHKVEHIQKFIWNEYTLCEFEFLAKCKANH